MKIFSFKIILIFISLLFAFPHTAMAHGDPILVYTVIFFPLLHFFCLIFIIISKYRLKFKLISAPLFLGLTAISYYFGLNTRKDSVFYIGMGIIPTVLFIVIFLFRGPKGNYSKKR